MGCGVLRPREFVLPEDCRRQRLRLDSVAFVAAASGLGVCQGQGVSCSCVSCFAAEVASVAWTGALALLEWGGRSWPVALSQHFFSSWIVRCGVSCRRSGATSAAVAATSEAHETVLETLHECPAFHELCFQRPSSGRSRLQCCRLLRGSLQLSFGS